MKRTFIVFLTLVSFLILAAQALACDKIPRKLALQLGDSSGNYLILVFKKKGKVKTLGQTYFEVAGEVIHDYGSWRWPVIGGASMKDKKEELVMSITGSTFSGRGLWSETSCITLTLPVGKVDPVPDGNMLTFETWAFGQQTNTSVISHTVVLTDTHGVAKLLDGGNQNIDR
jgi:hypothetical protein